MRNLTVVSAVVLLISVLGADAYGAAGAAAAAGGAGGAAAAAAGAGGGSYFPGYQNNLGYGGGYGGGNGVPQVSVPVATPVVAAPPVTTSTVIAPKREDKASGVGILSNLLNHLLKLNLLNNYNG